MTVSCSPPVNPTPAQCSQKKVENNGSRQQKRSIVRFKYDSSIEHQNCVKEFSESKSRAEE